MKTSCWTSHSSRIPRLALCLLLPLGACDSDADDKGDCWNQDSPSGASHPDGTKHRGQITVEHAVEYEGGPTGKTSRAVLATFAAVHPLGRNGQPADVAAAILFLASEESSWITGTVLPVAGGVMAGRQ